MLIHYCLIMATKSQFPDASSNSLKKARQHALDNIQINSEIASASKIMTLAPRFVFLRSSRNGYIAERHSPWVAGVRCAGSVLLSRSAASTPRCVRAEKLKTLK